MKKICTGLTIVFIVITSISCSTLLYRDYYNYSFTPTKSINFSTGKWIINPAPVELPEYKETFSKLTKTRGQFYNDLKDQNGKRLSLFEIKQPPSKHQLKSLSKSTGYDYFIFCYTKNTNKSPERFRDKITTTIKIYDLYSLDVIHESTCTGIDEMDENKPFGANLEKSTIKKLLSKIQKYAIK